MCLCAAVLKELTLQSALAEITDASANPDSIPKLVNIMYCSHPMTALMYKYKQGLYIDCV